MENATCAPLLGGQLFFPSSLKITEYRINISFASELNTVPENDQSIQCLTELRLSVGPAVFEWAVTISQMERDQVRST